MIDPYPDLMSAAESYVFETKGYEFSNNNDPVTTAKIKTTITTILNNLMDRF